MRFIEHLTIEGDRWDSLAFTYYGNPYGYVPIVEANPVFLGQLNIPSGQILRIPIIPVIPQKPANLPPWRR